MSVVGVVARGGCSSGLISTVLIGVSSCIVVLIFGMAGWGCVTFSSVLWCVGLAWLVCMVVLRLGGVCRG